MRKRRTVLSGCFYAFLQTDVLIGQVVSGAWERVHR